MCPQAARTPPPDLAVWPICGDGSCRICHAVYGRLMFVRDHRSCRGGNRCTCSRKDSPVERNIDIFANLTQVAEYHRNLWPTIVRNKHNTYYIQIYRVDGVEKFRMRLSLFFDEFPTDNAEEFISDIKAVAEAMDSYENEFIKRLEEIESKTK